MSWKSLPPLNYPWKMVVAAAVISLLVVGTVETRKRWPKSQPVVKEPDVPSGLYADTLSRIQEIIAAKTSGVPDIVSPGMTLVDLGIDPLTREDLAESLQTAFRIEVPADEMAKVETVDDLVQLMVRQQQNQKLPVPK